MNGSSPIQKNDSGTGLTMLAIFVGATAVGLAFNSMSPLGVRLSLQPVPSEVTAAAVQLYENETVAVGLNDLSSTVQPALVAPGGIYENETAGTRLEINPANDVAQPTSAIRTISWLETKALLAAGSIVLVDARASAYYETGHIPGATSLPTADATRDALAAFAAKYPKETPLVVYCGSPQCPLARQLIEMLTGTMGYTDVRDMVGGFVEYREAENQSAGRGTK